MAARVELSGSLQGQFAGITGEGQEFKVDQVIFMHLQDGKCKELWAIIDSESLGDRWGPLEGRSWISAPANRSLELSQYGPDAPGNHRANAKHC